MLGPSLRVEVALNVFLRGINALSGVYLATIIDSHVAGLFAYISAVNILKSIDFGYNFYQRHLVSSGFRLSVLLDSLFLILPVCCFIWIIPDNLITTILEVALTVVAMKYIGTYANIINKTWLTALPLSLTFFVFLFIDKSCYQEVFMYSSFAVLFLIRWDYSLFKLERNLQKTGLDWRLLRSSLLVFIPSFLYLLLSEYVFVYYQEVLSHFKYVALYLKLNAALISVIFLFNDLYWNRFGYTEWPWLWSRASQIVVGASTLLIVLFPSIITLLFGSLLSSIISGYYVRHRFVFNLFVAGLVETLLFFGGLLLCNISDYFLIVAVALSVKILITYYGKTIFNL